MAARVLVIGGSSGIGRATVEHCRNKGWEPVVADRRPPPAELGAAFYSLDVSDPESVRSASALVRAPLAGLVAAAGIQIAAPIEEMSDGDVARQIAVNLTGMAYALKYFGPLLEDGASVVLVASELAFIGTAESPVYAATKGGVVALARSLAVAWRHRRIRVNALCPGATDTPLIRAVWNAKPDPARAEAEDVAQIPLGRLACPAEIAAVAGFLLSADAAFVTGHALVADGGTIAW
jgi:NAD(P)-dependent dehydrogenase (short-subunit alcohol dehydrogenase family)